MNPTSYIAILGRQPKLGIAELERRFGTGSVTPLNSSAALLQTDALLDIDVLGGSVKIARLVERTNSNGWLGVSKQAVKYLERELGSISGKITLGVSAYGFDVSAREVQKTGLIVKTRLKNRSGSLRLIPSAETALSSAQTYHNKLAGGGTKREVILVNGTDGHGYIAEVTGVQDIDAYTLRDRGRPKRDALNGMLPPKLAQIMVNLAHAEQFGILWDPFCGTGVVLMEAYLMDIDVYGSDVNPKMVDYSKTNLDWLDAKHGISHGGEIDSMYTLTQGDATTIKPVLRHGETAKINYVVSETYLGEPMAQEPKPEKLSKVMEKCEEIISGFFVNVANQLESGTSLCIAVPAWRIGGEIKHLPVVDYLEKLGYNWIDFEHVDRSDLIYYREDQIVARELLVIKKA